MFDIGWTELALIGGVTIVLMGPEEMPRVLYKLGKIVRKIRIFTGDIQRSLDHIVNESEVDELEKEISGISSNPDLKIKFEQELMAEEEMSSRGAAEGSSAERQEVSQQIGEDPSAAPRDDRHG